MHLAWVLIEHKWYANGIDNLRILAKSHNVHESWQHILIWVFTLEFCNVRIVRKLHVLFHASPMFLLMRHLGPMELIAPVYGYCESRFHGFVSRSLMIPSSKYGTLGIQILSSGLMTIRWCIVCAIQSGCRTKIFTYLDLGFPGSYHVVTIFYHFDLHQRWHHAFYSCWRLLWVLARGSWIPWRQCVQYVEVWRWGQTAGYGSKSIDYLQQDACQLSCASLGHWWLEVEFLKTHEKVWFQQAQVQPFGVSHSNFNS